MNFKQLHNRFRVIKLMKISALGLLFFILPTLSVFAQTGVIKGKITNNINNAPLPYATIVVDSSQAGTTSDIDGNYVIENIKPGVHNITCSFIGFKSVVLYEVIVNPSKPTILNISLIEEATSLEGVEISGTPFNKPEESPVSIRTISATEIYRNPGGNRDISKVIQSFPGVATTVSFRNDIIVRGGAPNENRFYLDGIEVPNINHFATQGSSGGPVGMINVNFIREVDFYAGAFPANRGNALSSIMEFKQVTANDEKLSGTFMVGSSDVGLTLDGPLGKKSRFLFSARRSYLQFLFKALRLPFLPTYNDFQYKHEFFINDKNKLTLIGLGAIDDFEINKNVNDGVTDPDLLRRNEYILGNIPVNSQWNYTLGANWTHFSENSYQNIVVSRNHLKNKAIKYQNNVEDPNNLLLDYNSHEIENKVRLENTFRNNGWKINYGIGYENVQYANSTFNKTTKGNQLVIIDFDSKLTFNKYAAFGQVSKGVLEERLMLSFGVRTDFNDYSNDMNNPLKQFSPRLSASYAFNEKLSLNGNIARYYQLPAYTVLGYRDNNGNLVNKNNNITYVQADHFITGIEYNPTTYSKFTCEAFYKIYDDYPFLLADSISLANLGGDFGVIGNEAATSTSQGRSYGVEFFYQQKLSSSVYGILSYTYARSEFKDKNNQYVPSSWDNQHVLNITAGKRFKKNWEVGAKFRLLGGSPYTPYNVPFSSLKPVWDVNQQGVFDWNKLNTERNALSHGLDIRIDKKWFYKKWSLNVYIDVQNVYNYQTTVQPFLDVDRDINGTPITDPNNPLAYQTSLIENTVGTILPSIGLMIDF